MKITVFFVLLLSYVLCACTSKDSSGTNPFKLTIIQMNDIYEISESNNGEGGLARVAYYIDSVKKESENVLVFHAGDFLNPSLIGTLKDSTGAKINGKQMVEVMNLLSLDAVAFGNHEFDLNEDVLQTRLNEMTFPMVSGNVAHVLDGNREGFKQNGKAISENLSWKFPNGTDTLVVGLGSVTLPYTQKDWITYGDVIKVANEQNVQLQATCDLVLFLTHVSRQEDKKLAATLSNVPLILGGHDHYHYIDTVGNTYVAKADANAKTLWRHDLVLNESTKEWVVNSTLIKMDMGVAQKESVAQVVAKWENFARENTGREGFSISTILFKSDKKMDATESVIRSEQTLVGDWMTAAMLWSTGNGDVALLNSGSIRYDDELPSRVSEADVLKALPFGGGLVVTEITGKELKEILAVGFSDNAGTGGYFQLGKVKLSGSDWMIGETKMIDSKVYKVVVTSYLSSGKEKGLSVLADYIWYAPAKVKNGLLENDMRKILIAYSRSDEFVNSRVFSE
ncbi:MAG: bifunctional metallophosphatase/5'-nucleotidase [Flavobacteriales bacterium]|nr:bifunctional metallophosphatase/5'-nucleotidase [Flavobacteriales bacterium]